jgi:hypothetical protein
MSLNKLMCNLDRRLFYQAIFDYLWFAVEANEVPSVITALVTMSKLKINRYAFMLQELLFA